MRPRALSLVLAVVLLGALAPAWGDAPDRARRIDDTAAKKSAEAHGYSDVRQLRRSEAGTWRGVPRQYGKWSRFEIDANGSFLATVILEPAKPPPR